MTLAATAGSSHSPSGYLIIGAVFVVIVIILLIRHRGEDGSVVPAKDRDRDRAFSPSQRAAIFARCGQRCEHFGLFGRRCTAKPTHADHIYPHSRGGATSLANGAGLCASHNLEKSNHIPSARDIARLERKRRSYFPPGVPVTVVWRQSAR